MTPSEMNSFGLDALDYIVFASYFIVLSFIGLWVGRKKKTRADDYFLAGRTLPWYVIGSSYIAANISSEHFIGMVGAAYVYGICISTSEWANVWTFSLLIWFFIPRLLSSKVLTVPEFLEKRYSPALRQIFAIVSIVSNIIVFLAAVLYGGSLALQELFGWNLWLSIIVLAVAAGSWAIYGGLRSVAWTDAFTVVIMIAGGLAVTYLGLMMLSGDSHSLVEGFRVMIERNRAEDGVWAQAVQQNADRLAHVTDYNRLSVIQPVTHPTHPWPVLLIGWLSVGLWYNVINQFMIQNVLGARNMYHARMGIVLAGFLKVLLPVIVVIPGLILFAHHPDIMLRPWKEIRPSADKGYIQMLHTLVPAGLRGLFLAALFGAIQSTINAVLNSTSAMFTLDIYRRHLKPNASETHYVRTGRIASVLILCVAIGLAGWLGTRGTSLFVYIQTLYAFFAPPFAAVFLLGILVPRINGKGATAAVVFGFALAVAIKLYIANVPGHPKWLEPYSIQAFLNWLSCVIVCIVVSLATAPPRPEQVSEDLTVDWARLNVFADLGRTWYTSVVFWWALFVLSIVALVVTFSGLVF